MSSQVSNVRRGLNARQVETVDRLLVAGQAVLEDVGPDDLTIRMVASHAGVSPATAYTYLASKNHLFAEIYLRHIARHPAPELTGTPAEQLKVVVRHYSRTLLASPHLAAAANLALLSADPDVERLRIRIGAEFVGAFSEALGGSPDPALLDALTFAFSGALLQAGMGLLDADQMADRLDHVVDLLMRSHP